MPSTRQRHLNDIGGNTPTQATTSSAKAAGHSSRQQSPPTSTQNPLLSQWQFAALWEFLYQFHDGLKSAYYEDIEQFATDLATHSGTPKLHDVQIGLLKNVSSQRGLTIDQFEDYTRRQYTAKNPDANPFGSDEVPTPFSYFQPEQKVKILHQLCMWILAKPEIFREKVDRDKTADQTDWRIDPIGWDSRGNTYYQFDNGYLYCRTEPLAPAYQKWKNRKPKGGRATKRRRLSEMEEDEPEEEEEPMDENSSYLSQIDFKCVCSNLEEYRALVVKFEKSKHPDEKELRKVVIEDILPGFEKDEQKRQRKLLEEEKEQARLALLAGRKRSARVDERIARQRELEEKEQIIRLEREERQRERQEEYQRQRDEDARAAKLEERERRLQERELRAQQREVERTRLLDPDATESEDNGNPNGGRKSSRQKEKRKAELETEDNDWVFDCICGIHGNNYDDGTLSIACDKCGVWQHGRCLGLPESTAEENEFICDRCRDKEKAATSPPIKIKLRLTRPASSEGDTENGQTWPTSPLKEISEKNGLAGSGDGQVSLKPVAKPTFEEPSEQTAVNHNNQPTAHLPPKAKMNVPSPNGNSPFATLPQTLPQTLSTGVPTPAEEPNPPRPQAPFPETRENPQSKAPSLSNLLVADTTTTNTNSTN